MWAVPQLLGLLAAESKLWAGKEEDEGQEGDEQTGNAT